MIGLAGEGAKEKATELVPEVVVCALSILAESGIKAVNSLQRGQITADSNIGTLT